MTFGSSLRIILMGASLCACVNQYTSPGGEVENTSTESPSSESPSSESPSSESPSSEPPSSASDDSSEAASPASGSKNTRDESTRDPIEASGTCDDRSCVSTTDCCKGYHCAFDPERSKVIRYCLPQ